MSKENKEVDLDVLKQAYGRVLYTHTTHEYEVQESTNKIKKIKLANVVLTAVTFGGVLGILIFNNDFVKVISAILSTISLAVATYQLSFNPEQEKVEHTLASKELWYVREKYKNLIADVTKEALSEDQIIRHRDGLLEELKLIYKFAPNTSNAAYKKAQNAIQKEEEQGFSDAELNALLPKSLRTVGTKRKI